ncbi:MAG: zinc metallopeptidase [Clostridiales bacterium]|nr:zinc metallopeptidase [Clostridiales bacterium]
MGLLLNNTFVLLLVIGALFLGMYAQYKVQANFNKYSKVRAESGKTAYEVARQILDSNGLVDVDIVHISGNLTDHYDPRKKVVALSDTVYNSTSVAAIGIAAHEVGHAVQHNVGYIPIKIRNLILPVAQLGSSAYFFIFLLGIIFSYPPLADFGILLFGAVVLFQLVTLPVEFDASSRAKRTIEEQFILSSGEMVGVKKVLGAAAMTYVAALVSSAAQLLRMISISRRR